MRAVRSLCVQGIVFQNGEIIFNENIDEAVRCYLCGNGIGVNSEKLIQHAIANLPKDISCRLINVKLLQNSEVVFNQVFNDVPLEIEVTYEVLQQETGLRVYFDLCDQMGEMILRSFHDEDNDSIPTMKPGKYISKVVIPENFLGNTRYEIIVRLTIFNIRNCTGDNGIRIPIIVNNTGIYNRAYPSDIFRGLLGVALHWTTSIF
jgi:hypothetical protein